MKPIKRFGPVMLSLLVLLFSGCATTSSDGYLFYGSAAQAPVGRIEPGMEVTFTLRTDPRSMVRTVRQAYGNEGFVTTLGESVRYEDLDTMQFLYPSNRSERALENTRMMIAVPLLLPCMAVGACPMN